MSQVNRFKSDKQASSNDTKRKNASHGGVETQWRAVTPPKETKSQNNHSASTTAVSSSSTSSVSTGQSKAWGEKGPTRQIKLAAIMGQQLLKEKQEQQGARDAKEEKSRVEDEVKKDAKDDMLDELKRRLAAKGEVVAKTVTLTFEEMQASTRERQTIDHMYMFWIMKLLFQVLTLIVEPLGALVKASWASQTATIDYIVERLRIFSEAKTVYEVTSNWTPVRLLAKPAHDVRVPEANGADLFFDDPCNVEFQHTWDSVDFVDAPEEYWWLDGLFEFCKHVGFTQKVTGNSETVIVCMSLFTQLGSKFTIGCMNETLGHQVSRAAITNTSSNISHELTTVRDNTVRFTRDAITKHLSNTKRLSKFAPGQHDWHTDTKNSRRTSWRGDLDTLGLGSPVTTILISNHA